MKTIYKGGTIKKPCDPAEPALGLVVAAAQSYTQNECVVHRNLVVVRGLGLNPNHA